MEANYPQVNDLSTTRRHATEAFLGSLSLTIIQNGGWSLPKGDHLPPAGSRFCGIQSGVINLYGILYGVVG
jgi:hypothetical protein